MRHTPNVKVEKYRQHSGPYQSITGDGNNGMFVVPVGRATLCVICSDGGNWDHVSVSAHGRCPTWEEMAAIKALFFHDDETVVEFHPRKSSHVNCHPHCLHLWRPQDAEIKLPPAWMVGPLTDDQHKPSGEAFLEKVNASQD